MAEALQGNHFTSIVRSTYIHPGEAQLQWTEAESEHTPSRQTHTFMCKNTHTHKQKFRRTDTFIPFWFDFHENVMSAQKASADADATNTHTHTLSNNLNIYTWTCMDIHICICVCVWLCRTAARGQPHCAIIVVAAAVAVMWACACICRFWCLPWSAAVAQQEQQQQQPNNSGLWLQVCGARATFGRNFTGPFSQTHTHTYKLASIHTHSHMHSQTSTHTHTHNTYTTRRWALTCCTLHALSLVALGCCHCL